MPENKRTLRNDAIPAIGFMKFLPLVICLISMMESCFLFITCHNKVQIADIWRQRSGFFRKSPLGRGIMGAYETYPLPPHTNYLVPEEDETERANYFGINRTGICCASELRVFSDVSGSFSSLHTRPDSLCTFVM